jgi:D-amino-acid dehydrogenase
MAGRHVVIVGAGMVGVSCALHALRRGWRVTVVDPRGIAGGASSGNAGVIAVSECMPIGSPSTLSSVPRMLLSRNGPLHIRASYFPKLLPWLACMVAVSTPREVDRLSHALAGMLAKCIEAHKELAAEAGMLDRIRKTGWLKAYESDATFQAAWPQFEAMRRRGVECMELDRDGIGQFEPALAGRFTRAVLHPLCHQVGEPRSYVQALADHFVAAGGRFQRDEVTGFTTDGQRVASVRTMGGNIEADAVVLAAGAWSRGLAAQLGCEVPLDTERGYHMMLDVSRCSMRLQRPLYWGERSIVLSPMGESVRVTSSVEFAGLHARPDYELVRRHLRAVTELLPGAAQQSGSEWLGFRPSMPDSLPVIGTSPRWRNAHLSFGHGHLGITMGPITGRLVGALLDGTPPGMDLAPFSPERFRRGSGAASHPRREFA